MKIKTLTLLAGAACLASVFALTSCGSESVKLKNDFKAYSNEISKAAFNDKVASIDNRENLKGYTYKQYIGSKYDVSGSLNQSNVSSGEVVYKFNGNDKIVYMNHFSFKESYNDNYYVKEEKTDETQAQHNGEKFIDVNIRDKTYGYFYYPYDETTYSSAFVSNDVNSVLGTKIFKNDGVKFYSDNDVYTAVYSNQETKADNTENIKQTITTNVEAIYQFYISDDNFFVRSRVNETIEVTTTKDGKKSKMTIKKENVEDFEYDFSVPTIDLIDLSNYTEEINQYN